MLKRSLRLAAIALTVWPITASAQDGIDAHGFKMTAQDGDPRDLLSVERPGAVHGGEYYFTGLFEYAKDPLVVEFDYPEGHQYQDRTVAALTNVAALNLGAGYAVADWLRIDLGLPVFLHSASTDLTDPTATEATSQGGGLGDMRLGAMIAFLQPGPTGGFGMGFVPYLDLPTGNQSKFIGAPGLAGGAKLAATLEAGRFTVGGDLGAQFNPAVSIGNLNGADSLVAGLGAGVLFSDSVGMNLEAHFAPALKPNEVSGTGSPSELIASLRGRTDSGVHWVGGFASGLSKGAGAARYRLFLGAGFGKIESSGGKDRDGDGILDPDDVCPDRPEVFNSYKDTDGCPDELAKVTVYAQVNGKPVADADVAIVGPEDMKRDTTGDDGLEVELVPGDYTIKAAIPGYEGETSLGVKEGIQEAVVEMKAVTPAKVRITVVDSDGNPIDHAGISFAGEGAPAEGIALGDKSEADLDLPPGSYMMFVKAKKYSMFRADLVLKPGDTQEIKAVLGGQRVKVTKANIEILDKVYFETAKAVIRPESFSLLEEVANVIITNPELKLIEVAGHTDNQGGDDMNQKLSEDRAKAVKDFLVSKGVEASRLQAKGYGETRPIDTNDTAEGRARNRRVEFVILKK